MIRDQDPDIERRAVFFDKDIDQRGLSGTRLSRDNDKPLILHQRVLEMRIGIRVTPAHEKKGRVRYSLKGFFLEAVI
jgi:hypothetical protein